MAAASTLVALLVAEGTLRAVGFSFAIAPESIEFGWPDPVVLKEKYEPDPDLFFVPLNYAGALVKLEEQPPDVVYLGDSCTQFGSYPRHATRLLSSRLGRPIVGAQLGVGGWTSYQGLQQLERDVLPARPDVVTLYYGWNDHWQGFGIEDKEIADLVASSDGPLAGSRLAQLVFKARLAWRARGTSTRPLRVSLEDYRANLTTMVRSSRDAGVAAMLITAPMARRDPRDLAPLAERWVEDPSQVEPLHRAYADVVRDVAASEGAPLCDLLAAFDALPERDVGERYFHVDGIHMRDAGGQKLAELLVGCMEREGLTTRLAEPTAAGGL